MRVIAHAPHLISAAEALQRVFLPNCKLHSTCLRKPIPLRPQHLNLQYRHYGPRNNTSAQSNDGPIRDEGIRAPEIQIVGPDNSLEPPRRLRDSLASIDRSTHFLMQVGEKVHPRFADAPGPEEGERDIRPKIPVCKIIDKASYRRAKIAKTKPKKTAPIVTKEVEVNWNIAVHDLEHRLKKMREFLNDGRRVEVVFGKKRKGWMQRKGVTDGEAGGLLEMIRDQAATVEGSKEWKEMEGQEGGELRMFFEAKGNKQKGEAKVKEKEATAILRGG
ncbi:MAG: hypothetical protein Q9221_008759 [Calogaya cf. arnoldii]